VFDELIDASSMKPEVIQGVDLLVVRELTGGIYFGEPRANDGQKAYNTMVYSKDEIIRIAKVAFESAMKRRKKVCSVDKANVLEVSRLWRAVVEEVAVDYPQVELTHILTGNIFGDILSDEASMMTGSIGLLPSSSIGGIVGLYEPIHGSAPDIAGQGIANPLATILSASMMLRFSLGEVVSADIIDNAIKNVLHDGYRTPDLAKYNAKEVCSTSEIGSIIAERIMKA